MANKTNISIGAAIALLAAAYIGIDLKQDNQAVNTPTAIETQAQDSTASNSQTQQKPSDVKKDDTDKIAQAFARNQSDLQVKASGRVVALLRDDNEGSRHQKFILELNNGQTVLVAHNIDLSPRIDTIQKGDTVEFYGEYEYSDKGGVIHWTHHDPAGKHINGWLKHQGRTYQ
ncbi:hypothetical protein A3K93_07845 [Acinetobacter sp. NCu2D-2]|uniref:DUF3465 domain-containing protein n=1 Tax=Acinetobacter sp. NCu2D-2 TaxID=1608473 RepID=UPI0007CDACBA|nr:DUF3465 domain-containing protein [Acinetobacter sp. NCu2D-2]ANF82113.1 hypothetical protein A3K93_07845 [Acinetobacter sp. NCu2D-2]